MSRYAPLLALLSFLFATVTVSAQISLNPRSGGVVEWYNGNTRGVGNRVVPGPMMLMYGVGVYDFSQPEDRTDVWYSTTKGRTWAPVQQTEATFPPLMSAITVQDSQGRQFRIQGTDNAPPNAGTYSEVYMSTNGGVSWTLQGELPSDTGRFLGQAVVDSRDAIYVLMGQGPQWVALNDIWTSANQGRTWRKVNSAPSRTPPSRAVHGAVAGKFRDGTDALWVMYGWQRFGPAGIGNVYTNDVWVTTTGGQNWVQVLAHAPWASRGDCQIEITSTGIIIIAGGVSSANADEKRQLNDIWASLDGGYSWGQCTDNAEFSDRQFQYTLIDDEGYLYVMGGREESGGTRQVNDVWRSVFSYNDVTEVAARCGLFVPSCGVGLKCLPEDEGFRQGGWGVSCAACPYNANVGGSGGSSSSSNTITILFVVFLLLFLASLSALVYTYYKMRASGVASPIPLPAGAARWWNSNTGGTGGTLGEGLTHEPSATDSYKQLSIRDQV